VRFQSQPGGAVVRVDRDPALSCTTPCTLRMGEGRHTYTLAKSGYRSEIRVVEVAGSGSSVDIQLQQSTGMIRVSSTPAGAAIYVNGRKRDEVTPATLRLAPGKYKIAVENNGRRTEEDITLREDALMTLNVQLN
jgi:hypothetical protein